MRWSEVRVLSVVTLVAMVFAVSSAWAVPGMILFQGRIADPGSGTPITDPGLSMSFRIYAAAVGGEPLWEESHTVPVTDGVYSVMLGSTDGISPSLLASDSLWLEVEIEGEQLLPRQRIGSVVFSIKAGDADTLDGHDSTEFIAAAGGTMTGILNLATNGLTVGTTQLALSGGKVGIGTSSPQDKLEVSGGMVTFDSGPENSITGLRIRENGDMRWTLLYRTWEGDNLHIYDEVRNQSTMTFQSNTGRVGVGVTAPESRLHVAGGQWNVGGTEGDFKVGSSTHRLKIGVALDGGGAGDVRIRAQGGSNRLMLGGGAGDDLTLQNGNVGIGTVAPVTKLDVVGDVRVTGSGSGFVFPDGTKQTTAVTSSGFGLPLSESSTSADTMLFSIRNVEGLGAVQGKAFNQSTARTGYGVIGDAYCPNADAYGLFGHATGGSSKTSYGVYGEVGPILPGQQINGYGVFGKNTYRNTWGYVGGDGVGVQGNYKVSDIYSNYGQMGTPSYGVYGYHTSGNKGHIGSQAYAVYADSLSGTALYAIARGNGDAALHAVATGGGFAGVFEGALRITGGSDLSEPFDIRPSVHGSKPIPGMVVSIDDERPGQLVISSVAYDRKVAGVISGAGGIKPGMVMGQEGTIADGANPVALSGRVYCLADAGFGVIQPGDLLTTSETPGHAMRVADYPRAQGAVIGKAMTALEKDRGLVLVLVSLQ